MDRIDGLWISGIASACVFGGHAVVSSAGGVGSLCVGFSDASLGWWATIVDWLVTLRAWHCCLTMCFCKLCHLRNLWPQCLQVGMPSMLCCQRSKFWAAGRGCGVLELCIRDSCDLRRRCVANKRPQYRQSNTASEPEELGQDDDACSAVRQPARREAQTNCICCCISTLTMNESCWVNLWTFCASRCISLSRMAQMSGT